MSESVIDSGTLTPITLTEAEAEAECERLEVDLEFYDSPHEALSCETDEYADITGLGLCKVENFKTEDPTESSCTVTKTGEASYTFRASYYNGGAHWTELVAWAVKRDGLSIF